MTARVFAADIGGSHARFGLFNPAGGWRRPIRTARFATHEADSAAALVTRFLRGERVQGGCVAVAGAVLDGRARGPNLPWEVVAERLSAAARAPVGLVNDLVAFGHFVAPPPPPEGDPARVPLRPGAARPGGAVGLIALGTGLGHAFLPGGGERPQVCPSEAGHVDFAPVGEVQERYLAFLRGRGGRVSLERACSGGALPGLYRFLCREGVAGDAAVARRVDTSADPAPVIVRAGLRQRCGRCRAALELLVEMLGAAAGNLALTLLATGGIFLGGGLAIRLRPMLQGAAFERAFRAKGSYADLVASIPVTLVCEPLAALYGAARLALPEQDANAPAPLTRRSGR